VRNTTLPLIKYGIQFIRTYLKFIWNAPNYFIIHPLGGRLTNCKIAANGEATFHVSGKVNKQNVLIWRTEKPHRIVENKRDSPKTNVFYAISTSKCMARTSFLIEPWMAKHSGTCWIRGLCHNWNMTVLTSSISWMEPHATMTVMSGTSLMRYCHMDGLEEQSTMTNIFYSNHRGHRTWHPVIFSYGDTLKTIPTNHHSPKMCEDCKNAFELWCKPLMGTCWSASGRS